MKIACSLVVCLAVAGPATASDEKPTIRVYTNEDLERLHAKRGETGVTSDAAALPMSQPAAERPSARGEPFWRREAERERRRLEPLRQRLLALEQRLAERRANPKRRPSGQPLPEPEPLAAQIQALQARIRDQESRFEDRARREGALPGWLR